MSGDGEGMSAAFQPLTFLRIVALDDALTTAEAMFLVAAALSTDNTTRKVRQSLGGLAGLAKVKRGSVTEMMKRERVTRYFDRIERPSIRRVELWVRQEPRSLDPQPGKGSTEGLVPKRNGLGPQPEKPWSPNGIALVPNPKPSASICSPSAHLSADDATESVNGGERDSRVKPEPKAARDGDGDVTSLHDAIESTQTVDDLRRLWAEHRAVFEVKADLTAAYKARGRALSAATETRPDDGESGEAEQAKPCGCPYYATCAECSRYRVRQSTLPEPKQRELHERQMAEEGLDPNGEPLEADRPQCRSAYT